MKGILSKRQVFFVRKLQAREAREVITTYAIVEFH